MTSITAHPAGRLHVDWLDDNTLWEAMARGERYDFLKETAEKGIWRVRDKRDRVEYVARDVTGLLVNPDSNMKGTDEEEGPLTATGAVLLPGGGNVIGSLMAILNHENLVNVVDWVVVAQSSTIRVRSSNARLFFVSDFCDAGVLENLFNGTQTQLSTAYENTMRDREREFADMKGKKMWPTPQGTTFLPESLCWHVMVSVLRALLWLHHGACMEFDTEEGDWVCKLFDVDWLTILHRNISPRNIFFCHPQTRETYGLCKLGDFGKAHVSGHFNGVQDKLGDAEGAKVLAPRDEYLSLNELRVNDGKVKACHPPRKNQPYTILDEYRAVGDVIRCMMYEVTGLGPRAHADEIRQQPPDWKFDELGYSKTLKNMVYKLMSSNDAWPGSTWRLYTDALGAFEEWQAFTLEGSEFIPRETTRIIGDGIAREMADEIKQNLENNQDQLDNEDELQLQQKLDQSDVTGDKRAKETRNTLLEVSQFCQIMYTKHPGLAPNNSNSSSNTATPPTGWIKLPDGTPVKSQNGWVESQLGWVKLVNNGLSVTSTQNQVKVENGGGFARFTRENQGVSMPAAQEMFRFDKIQTRKGGGYLFS